MRANSRRLRRAAAAAGAALLVAVLLAVLVAVGVVVQRQPAPPVTRTPAPPVLAAGSQPGAGAGTEAASPGAPRPGGAPMPGEAGPAEPPGVSAEQWQALRTELARRPDGAAELQRISAHLAFQHDVQQLRAQRLSGAADPALHALAERIDNSLTRRLQERELSAAEATRLKAAVLDVLVADAAERSRQLQQWQQARGLEAQARQRPDPREPEFLRRQAAVLAAWQAQPPAQRDPQRLQQQLDALRLASFPDPRPPTGEPR